MNNFLKAKMMPPQIRFLISFLNTHTHTCAHTLAQRHSINFIKEDLRYKLGHISEKLYRYHTPFQGLTSEDQKLWLSFDIDDITFFLSSQREWTPDYTQYMWVSAQPKQPIRPQPQPVANHSWPNTPSWCWDTWYYASTNSWSGTTFTKSAQSSTWAFGSYSHWKGCLIHHENSHRKT